MKLTARINKTKIAIWGPKIRIMGTKRNVDQHLAVDEVDIYIVFERDKGYTVRYSPLPDTVQLNSQLFSLSMLHIIYPLKSCPEATTLLGKVKIAG